MVLNLNPKSLHGVFLLFSSNLRRFYDGIMDLVVNSFFFVLN
ncbi:hypothetical protein FCR2A7T_19190 [Flavobacterium cauense R2A-7]|nr:hypothetical protein FCR2A7T_19190 [Flavobacterium cauense R2A-7]